MLPKEKKLISTNEICHKLQISSTTLWRLRKKGVIPFIKVGKSVLFDYEEVLSSLKEQTNLGGMSCVNQ